MDKISPLVFTLILVFAEIQAGSVGPQFAYNSAYLPPIPFSGEHNCDSPYGYNYEAQFAAPLPVAPLAAPHHYAAVGYSAPPTFRYRSRGVRFSPFTSYAAVRSHHKFAFPAPVPSFYNSPAPVPSFYSAPPPVTYGPPGITYNSFAAPNTVVKFGPPITTTTTTYSATAAAAASVPVPQPLNTVGGW